MAPAAEVLPGPPTPGRHLSRTLSKEETHELFGDVRSGLHHRLRDHVDGAAVMAFFVSISVLSFWTFGWSGMFAIWAIMFVTQMFFGEDRR